MADTALLIIDIQNDYFPGGKMTLEGIERATENAARLLAHFRASGQPTFHIQHTWDDPSAPFFVAGTPGAAIHESIAPKAGEPVIVKHFPNSFRESKLADALRAAGVDRLAICGAMSHMCIDATTRAASDMGFDCVVAHDACARRARAKASDTSAGLDRGTCASGVPPMGDDTAAVSPLVLTRRRVSAAT